MLVWLLVLILALALVMVLVFGPVVGESALVDVDIGIVCDRIL